MNNGAAKWWKMDHDKTIYPLYDAAAKPSWQKELDSFFTEVAYTGGSFKDLLLSNIAFVNKDNAAMYGLNPADYTTELKKVELDATQRPGFLTRVGFLSSYAAYNATSPILRGAFILTYLAGANPGAPLPGVDMIKVDGNFTTQRSYVQELTKPDACNGCHQFINAAGFPLENYDAIGKWQTKDPRGGDIDATVTTSDVDFGNGAKRVTSALELMQLIVSTPKAPKQYAQAWVSYAFGRLPNANDQCVVDSLDANLAKAGYRILDLLADLTQADSFRLRVRETP
jgi:hypothetical protein